MQYYQIRWTTLVNLPVENGAINDQPALHWNELSIAEAFFACVLKHPQVISLAASALPGSSMFDRVFLDGCYPGPYIDYHWPLNVAADDLAFHFVKPVVFFLDDPLPTAPRALVDVCGLLVEQIKTLRDLLYVRVMLLP